MYKITVLFVLCFVVLASCDKSSTITPQEVDKNYGIWDELTIDLGDQRIKMYNTLDYGTCDKWDFNEIQEGSVIRYEPINHRQESFAITWEERKALYDCIYDIVKKPVYPDYYTTCYAGYISVGYSTFTTTLSCTYKSVGNWTEVSPQMEKLCSLLKEKIEIPNH